MKRFLCIVSAVLYVSLVKSQGLIVESTAFANTHYIPYRYTCDGENINPGLRITKIPPGTKSLALVMIDTNIVLGVFDHWVVWNIPVAEKINENSSPGVVGLNSRKENKYTGPCPPNGIHEYHFKVYALDAMLDLPEKNGKAELMNAMKTHIMAEGEATGLFQRE